MCRECSQRNLAVTASTYSHVLVSEDEVAYEEMPAMSGMYECPLSTLPLHRFRHRDREALVVRHWGRVGELIQLLRRV
jgi:hypothetical protein